MILSCGTMCFLSVIQTRSLNLQLPFALVQSEASYHGADVTVFVKSAARGDQTEMFHFLYIAKSPKISVELTRNWDVSLQDFLQTSTKTSWTILNHYLIDFLTGSYFDPLKNLRFRLCSLFHGLAHSVKLRIVFLFKSIEITHMIFNLLPISHFVLSAHFFTFVP